jgi:glycogen operon protein
VLANPPLLEEIAGDPVLAQSKLIAEAWDAAGLYQVGSFPNWGRWAEWNGRFRDDVRRFVRGDAGAVGALATRIAGSSDLYQHDGRAPYHSINFVTSHDGFTLADLVSYDRKRNAANGELGRDGSDDNLSWGCGVDGPTGDPDVRALRRRQARNLAAILLLSQGVPMILGGDELGRTQGGNNNAYCQDNATSFLDWSLRERHADLFRFFAALVRFRAVHPALRRRSFTTGRSGRPWVTWHGTQLLAVDWSGADRCLAFELAGNGDEPIVGLLNMSLATRAFELPALAGVARWRVFLDTAEEPPLDVTSPGEERPIAEQGRYAVRPHAVAVLVGR